MKSALLVTLCATLLILSLGLRPPVSEAAAEKTFTEKEARVLDEIKKISSMLYAVEQDKNEIDFVSFNKTVNNAFKVIRDLGYAHLCSNEFSATLNQTIFTDLVIILAAKTWNQPLGPGEVLLFLINNLNQDCVPIANLLSYVAVEAGNLMYGLNNTFTPKEGSILKLSDLGISQGSLTGMALGAVSTSLDALRCVSASMATLIATGNFLVPDALTRFELAALHAFAAGASCSNVYTSLRQAFRGALAK